MAITGQPKTAVDYTEDNGTTKHMYMHTDAVIAFGGFTPPATQTDHPTKGEFRPRMAMWRADAANQRARIPIATLAAMNALKINQAITYSGVAGHITGLIGERAHRR